MEADNRDYSLTDAELMMFTSNLVQTLTRDAAEFADYGVDAAAITALEALGNDFEVFPPDNYYQSEVGIAVEKKDNDRESLMLETRRITNRAFVKWGERSPRYKKFGIKGMNNMSDKSMLATARLVVMTATDFLSELSDQGLTQAIIDSYSSAAQTFEDDMNAISSAIEIRDSKTRERILMGNNLYSYVARYCRIGKTIWEKVDEAKYNDYVIYKNAQPGMGKVKNLSYDAASHTATWDALPLAIDYQLETKLNDGTSAWALAWEGTGKSHEYDPGAGDWLFRCRGHNEDGYGDWSDELNVHLLS